MHKPDFGTIYQQYYKTSFLFVKSYVRNEMAAEDIVSDAIIQLWQTLKKEEVDNIPGLLVTILKNYSLNYLKHETIRQSAMEFISSKMERDLNYRILTLEACDPEEIFSKEIIYIVQSTLESLPAQTRRIFEMSRYEHKSVKEIATELSLSTKSVEYHITRSLKALRLALHEYLPIFYLLFGYMRD